MLVVLRKNGRLGEDGRTGLISARCTNTCGRHVKWLNQVQVLRYR